MADVWIKKKKKRYFILNKMDRTPKKRREKKHHDTRIHEIKNTIHSEMKYLVLC